MNHSFSQYIDQKELEIVIQDSWKPLQENGIDPSAFYTLISENPEINPEEILNELLGSNMIKDAWAGVKRGVGNMFAGRQAGKTQQDIDAINNMSQADKDRYGFSPQVIQQMQSDLTGQQARAGQGFRGGVGAGWQQARQDRANTNLQQRYAALQQKYNTGPFASQGATPQTSAPQTATQPQTAQPAAPQSAAPQAQPQVGGGFDAKGAASQLSRIMKSLGNAKRPGMVKILQNIIGQLQSIP